jgi:multiple antibiotic resistance protein
MLADLLAFVKSILLVFTALLPIINPPGVAPIFLTYTHGATDRERRLMAKRIALHGFFLLLGAMFVGTYVLKFFGIQLAVVKVAGGLVVAAAGWRLLNAEDHGSERKAMSGPAIIKQSFYPLTFPFTIGPGTISVAITLGASLRSRDGIEFLNLAGGVIGVFLLLLTVYFAYRFANRLLERLGETGITVFLRLSAFILLAIGVEILWGGASELLRTLVDTP